VAEGRRGLFGVVQVGVVKVSDELQVEDVVGVVGGKRCLAQGSDKGVALSVEVEERGEVDECLN